MKKQEQRAAKRRNLFDFTLAAVLSALAVVLLLLASVLPVADLSIVAVAGFCPLIALWRSGRRFGMMTWVSASVLGLLLTVTREAAILFVFLFGPYPLVKDAAESSRSRFLAWMLKLLFANAGLAVIAGMSLLFFPELLSTGDWPIAALWVAFNAVFVLYDIALTRLRPFILSLLTRVGGSR